ncbi:MAG: 2-methylfumaryl-CoA isomerase [Acidimicrobiia bacterium]|nr:2-methylfumaryl-CoA isomerase [Acidimicrobiia bacterium]MYG73530.1 2-methylfumaryl-CoA isomerase [Acidimicrobiia bacterium]
MSGVLSGMRVVEGSAFVACPSGGMTLAQHGADVIRFDAIGGGIDYHRWPLTPDGQSLYWQGLNKGKRSIQVDLRSPEGRELITALATAPGPDAGIFTTNFPAVGWLSYDSLRQHRDDLIMVAITGNHDGSTAVDYTVNCAMGYPWLTGTDGTINHVLPAWDIICGQTAAVGVLAAERQRSRTGQGSLVNLALSDVALAAVSMLGHVAEAQLLGTQRPRIGNDIYGAFGRDFELADGERIQIVAVSSRQWQSIVAACGIGEAVAALEAETGLDFTRVDGDRYLALDRLNPLVAQWCAKHSLAEASAALDAEGVCWGRYQSMLEMVANDPRCSTENPLFTEVNHPETGQYLTPGPPLRFSDDKAADPGPAPRLGQHTDEVLGDVLGLSTAEIASLHDRQVVA